MSQQIRLALVCTSGGHFEQMLNLSDFYGAYPHFWITAPSSQTKSALGGERAYFIPLAHFKKPWTYFSQFPQVIRAFCREKPTHLVSTGSGRIVFVPFLLAKLVRAEFIHIETFSHVDGLTKMGRLLSRWRSPVLTQWPGSPGSRSIYIGPIIRSEELTENAHLAEGHVFVTVGTRNEPFTRLLRAVNQLRHEGLIAGKIIIQAGNTPCASELMQIFDFGTTEQIDELILGAKYVITQESAGIVTKCLKYGKRFIVMPRDYAHGELPAKSDMNEDLHIKLAQLGYTYVVHDIPELRTAIQSLPALKVGYKFDNSRAIAALKRIVES